MMYPLLVLSLLCSVFSIAALNLDPSYADETIGALTAQLMKAGIAPEQGLAERLNTVRAAMVSAPETVTNATSIKTFATYTPPAKWTNYPTFQEIVSAYTAAQKQQAINSELNQVLAAYTAAQQKATHREDIDQPLAQVQVQALTKNVTTIITGIKDYCTLLGITIDDTEQIKTILSTEKEITSALAPLIDDKNLFIFLQQKATSILKNEIEPHTPAYDPIKYVDMLRTEVIGNAVIRRNDIGELHKIIRPITQAFQTVQGILTQVEAPRPVQAVWNNMVADYYETFLASGITIIHARLLAPAVATKCATESVKKDQAAMEASIKDNIATLQNYCAAIPEIRDTKEMELLRNALNTMYTNYAKATSTTYQDHDAKMTALGLRNAPVSTE